MKPRPCSILVCFAACALPSCAIHYFDEASGTHHVWGFGHLKMRVQKPSEGVRAVFQGVETFGAAIGTGDEDFYLLVGYQNRNRLLAIDQSTQVRLDWPDNHLFHVKVGSAPPAHFTQTAIGETLPEEDRQ